MNCFFTNAHGVRNKQEGLGALVWSQSYNIIGISETLWEESCDWSAVMGSYRLFRRDRQVRQRDSMVCKGAVGLFSTCSWGRHG